MTRAVKHAILNRDVSHLTFPDEIQRLPAGDEIPQTPEGRITSLEIAPPEESLEKAVSLILNSKRPVIVVGHGARFHMNPVINFAEMLSAPVLTTFKGKGLIPDTHSLAAGVLGASFSNHTGITPKKPTIQVDFDPLVLSKFHKIDVALWGEISVCVKAFSEAAMGHVKTVDQRPELEVKWTIWRNEKKKRLLENRGHGISSIAVFDQLSRIAPEDAIICVDVGNNAYSLGRYFECKQQTFLMSGYLGSIGFSFPAALGAWAATRGDRPVIAVAGDGGFAQYMAELATSVKYNMNIKMILLNNSELGKISKEQQSGELDVWATDLHNPDFSEFATGCGALGLKVTKKEELPEMLNRVITHQGTALIEIMTDVLLI